MPRPPVDIVVPFVGTNDALDDIAKRLQRIHLRDDDSVTVADNRQSGVPGARSSIGRVSVVAAPGLPSSYFARNRGAEQGTNPWIVFLDADVFPDPEIVDRYFSEPVPDEAGILIGGIHDEEPTSGTAVEYHAFKRGSVGHTTTVREDGYTFAQTANVAVRREAFSAVGGFVETIRSGGDADLCFRVKNAGWSMESRHDASVIHQNRSTLKGFVRQYLRYGSGSAWLQRAHPGFSPRPSPVRVGISLGAAAVRALGAAIRGQRLEARVYLLDGVQKAAFVAGRLASNDVQPKS